MKAALPEVVLNESVVDHTSRVLLALSRFGFTEAGNRQVARAVRWLKSMRQADGSWEGTWFVDYVYQTANVLGAMAQVKAEMSADDVEQSLSYIIGKQREDGGWGESPSSFSAQQYIPLDHSSPTQTALILFGLLNFLEGTNFKYMDRLKEPVNSAINYLLATQGADGLWNDATYAGVVFPQIQYARYPIFQESIMLLVLGMYSQHKDLFETL
jgi:squalene-hopene/tetraprenyl-beta-curcumene cyclase